MTRTRALSILGALVILLIWGLLPSTSGPARRVPPPGLGDAALYLKVVERLGLGEPYYDALGRELRADNYPTRSPFNWRTPLHLVFVASATVPAAMLLLKQLALAGVLATAAVLLKHGKTPAVVGMLAQMGALATSFSPDGVAVSELWAGVLVALSVCAYYRAYWVAGALLGVASVFIRELAAPYCAACALIALQARRREAAVWILAGVAYAGYYIFHVWQVSSHQLPGDLVHLQSWQQWNGLQFTLATVAVNGWLSFVPRWVSVVYVVVALAGTASAASAPQVRWPLLVYFLLFAVVGLPFNYYWGFITAPLWAFGIAHGADGLRRLVVASTTTPDRNGGHAEAASNA